MRNGLLGAVAAWLACGGFALGQSYLQPVSPPGYPVPGSPAMIYPVAYQPPWPPYPAVTPAYAPVNPMPVIRGWPPPPGSIPPPPGSIPPPPGFGANAGEAPVGAADKEGPRTKFFPLIGPKSSSGKNKNGNQSHRVQKVPADAEGSTATKASAFGQVKSKVVLAAPEPGTPLLCEAPVCVPVIPPHEVNHANDLRSGPHGFPWYGQANYLLWWVNDRRTPPLLTIGVPGEPSMLLVGGPDLDFDNQQRQGTLLTLGRWLDSRQTVALEASLLLLAQRTPTFVQTSDSTVALGRPFFNTFSGVNEELLIASTGHAGIVNIEALCRIYGAEANLRKEFLRTSWGHLDWLAGFRFFELDENINIDTVDIENATGTKVFGSDRFGTHNRFFGGQLGLEGELNFGWFFVDLWGKMALGMNQQLVDIQGTGGDSFNGLLANPTNFGRYSFQRFTALPSAGANVGMQVLDHLRLSAGYSILFLNNAVRPGDQMNVNVALGPGVGPSSTFTRHETSFWAQGLNFGLEFRY